MAFKIRERSLVIAGVIGGLLACVPSASSSATSKSFAVRELTTSNAGMVWSLLRFPGQWAVASLHLQGVGHGADTLLSVGVLVIVYYAVFLFISQVWRAKKVSSARPKDYAVVYDDDPEIVTTNPFRRRGEKSATSRQYPSLLPAAARLRTSGAIRGLEQSLGSN